MHKQQYHFDGAILGFDFGTRHIGVAVGQALTKTAQPLLTLSANAGEPEWSAVEKVIQEWRPQALVVGIPLNMDGTEQTVTHQARDFMQQLAAKVSIPVFEIDERLSTIAAREQIIAERGYKALSKGMIDAMAAAIILETWFAEHV